jgi:hypothetical protein
LIYLTPDISLTPIYDEALEDVFQANVAGITATDPTLVRPRWQPEPPNQPAFTTDWVAMGVSVTAQDWGVYQAHDPTIVTTPPGSGGDRVERDEFLELLLSFYGPNCHARMAQWRDGIMIEPNRWELYTYGIKLVEVMDPVYLPALLKETNVKRVDLRANFARRIKRVYAIQSVADVTVAINNVEFIDTVVIHQ